MGRKTTEGMGRMNERASDMNEFWMSFKCFTVRDVFSRSNFCSLFLGITEPERVKPLNLCF